MSTSTKRKLASAREAGLVSIMVTMVLMIVVSLIVLGFAQIARRNQRQALDRQLSTQAFYAAESGVNDARQLMNAAIQAGQEVPAKDDCGPGSGAEAAFYASLSPNLDTDVRYTCVMVDPTPQALLYGDVGQPSTLVPIISANGANVSAISLAWQSKADTSTPTNNCPTTTSGVFLSTGNWQCGYGVLRVDLVPVSGALDYANLQNRTMTTFLVPLRPGSGGATNTIGYVAGGGENRLGVNCSDANCTMQFTGLNTNQYYMRVSSIYKNVSLRVNALDNNGNNLELAKAQALIDSTGKAQDVLRRIQVHVPLSASRNQLGDYPLQSTDSICKRFVVMSDYFDTQVDSVDSSNPLCQP